MAHRESRNEDVILDYKSLTIASPLTLPASVSNKTKNQTSGTILNAPLIAQIATITTQPNSCTTIVYTLNGVRVTLPAVGFSARGYTKVVNAAGVVTITPDYAVQVSNGGLAASMTYNTAGNLVNVFINSPVVMHWNWELEIYSLPVIAPS